MQTVNKSIKFLSNHFDIKSMNVELNSGVRINNLIFSV